MTIIVRIKTKYLFIDDVDVRHYGMFELETTDITSKKGKIKCRYNIYS